MSDDVLTRPAPPPEAVLRYGEAPEHVADLRLPPAGAGPLVVVVHGGFWKAAWDRTHLGPMASALASAGFVVAVPEYRRVGMPGGGWPGTALDVEAAVRALPGLVAAQLGGRASAGAPVLVGHSAGGHLAVWAALRARVPCAGVVSLAGVLDLPLAARLRLGGGAVQAFLGGKPDDVPQAYADADPGEPAAPAETPADAHPTLGDVPVTVVHGTRDADVPVEVGRAFAARRPGTRLLEPDADHFDLVDPTSPTWPLVVAELHRRQGEAPERVRPPDDDRPGAAPAL